MPRRVPAALLSLLLALAGIGLLAPGAEAARSKRPTVTSVSPGAAPAAATTRVTVYGSRFKRVKKVYFGKRRGTNVVVLSKRVLQVTTPAIGTGRTVRVRVVTSRGTSRRSKVARFTSTLPTLPTPPAPVPPVPPVPPAPAAPALTSLSPTTGSVAGGTTVTLTGTALTGTTGVTFGGTAGTNVTVLSATSVSVTTPAHLAGAVDVVLTTPAGSSTLPSGFTYTSTLPGTPPTALALAPSSGPIAGGTSVTVAGTGFVAGDTTVTIDGTVIPSGSVTVTTPLSLSFSTPAHAAGNVAVAVTTSGGTSSPVAGGFTYQASTPPALPPTALALAPSSGPTTGGTSVTVTGTGFVAGDTTVTIDGTVVPSSSVTVTTPLSLTFTTPAHAAGNVPVTVTTSAGTSSAVPSGFTYQAAPTVTSLSPTSGLITGLTLVTVTGTGFVTGDTTVTIGGSVVALPLVLSSTSLTFLTPAHAAGNVAVSVSTSGGTSSPVAGGFTYLAPPTALTITPALGATTGGTSVTVTGTGFVTGATTVTIGGTVVPSGSVTVTTPLSLTFTTPAHAAGNVSVTVTTAGGTSSAVLGGFTYVAAPTVTSLSPGAGSTLGGTPVTVIGTGFAPLGTTVTVGGTPVLVLAISSTSLTFLTPAHALGNVAVTVSTAGGTVSAPGGYTYVSPV